MQQAQVPRSAPKPTPVHPLRCHGVQVASPREQWEHPKKVFLGVGLLCRCKEADRWQMSVGGENSRLKLL